MRALALAILASLASAAAADPRPAVPPTDARGDCARARKAGKTCELTIEPEDVGGSKPDPGGIDVRGRRFEPAGSLLRLRRDFIDAIVKAADDL